MSHALSGVFNRDDLVSLFRVGNNEYAIVTEHQISDDDVGILEESGWTITSPSGIRECGGIHHRLDMRAIGLV